MTDLYDIAIIGAGPAGSTLARELATAREDMKILLIDGQNASLPKPCGGLLAPDAQKVLASFDLTLPKQVLADPQIFAVETIDFCSRRVRYYQRHYLNMDRYAFDSWLVSLIPDRVEICKCRCIEIEQNEDIFSLTLRDGTKVQTLAIVGADGASSMVRRKFFYEPTKKYIAIQQHFKGSPHSAVPYYSCIFDPETSDSCSWSIHKDDEIIFGGAFDIVGGRENFESQKARLEEFIGTPLGEPILTEACTVCSPRRRSDFLCGGAGIYLVGEAAGFISSSSFEGISSAMLSGKYLADAIRDASDVKGAIKSYREKCRKLQLKLYLKTHKRRVLCSSFLRNAIMASGIMSVEKYSEKSN
jgi:flavin-dependent dehydrogenase